MELERGFYNCIQFSSYQSDLKHYFVIQKQTISLTVESAKNNISSS